MGYTMAEGRQELLDQLATATDMLGSALAELTEAYEQVDEQTGDRLEANLFRPLTGAYGLAKRTFSEFAERYGMPSRRFADQNASGRPHDVRGMIDRAADQLAEADQTIAELQDSMLPVEVGDKEVRAQLARVRELISPLPERADEFIRVLGR
jgi:hypothetical protein